MDAPGSLSYCDFINHCYIDYIYFIINFMYVLEAVGLAFISLTLQIVSITADGLYFELSKQSTVSK